MSTNHNRIKVADLEINEPNKILTTNTSGELEFSDINNIKIDSYNALDYSIAGKALDARQGKILKDLIDNINALLASDNVNLDTVQELVDAIETVQISLSTILVNDLSTGGTTKALTAEMGKNLKTQYDTLATAVLSKEPVITGGAAGQYYDYSKTWVTIPVVDISGKQNIANQVEVNTSQNAQASWHGKTVFFTANVTITIPSTGLPSGYTFEGVTVPGCSITWAITSPKIWSFGTPAATPEKSIFTLMQLMSNSNNIYLFG